MAEPLFGDMPTTFDEPTLTPEAKFQEMLSQTQSPTPSLDMSVPPPKEEPGILEAAGQKVMSGFMGLPISRGLVSAGIGAAAGSAFMGVGAVPGAIIGAATGVLTDYLGAAADVATQRAIGPEGVELPGGITMSAEVGGMLADIGTGLIGGQFLFKGAAAIGRKVAPKALTAGQESALAIKAGTASKVDPRLIPNDPRSFEMLHPEASAAFNTLASRGYDTGLHNTTLTPDMMKTFGDLMKPFFTSAGGTSVSDTVFGTVGRGMSKVLDVIQTRMARMFTAPWRVVQGDPSAERALKLMTSSEMMGRAISHSVTTPVRDILKQFSTADKEFLKRAWSATQGLPRQSASRALGIVDEAPEVAPRIMLDEHAELLRTFLRRQGREDLIPLHEGLSKMFKDLGDTLVAGGSLKPEELIANYLPHLRATSRAEQARIVQLTEGYRPLFIDHAVPDKAKGFMLYKRKSDVLPKDFTLDQLVDIYAHSASNVLSRNAIIPQMQELMPLVEGTRAGYMTQLFNHFMGAPGSSKELVGHQAMERIKSWEFFRTIGGSLLTSLTNSAQRLNVLANTDTKNWVRAIRHNPQFVEEATKRGLLPQGINMADMQSMDGTYNGLMKGVKGFLGKPFFVSERGNILHAFQAGTYQALERGLPLEAAYQYGQMVAERTQFVSRIGRTPLAFTSDVGGVIGQFKSFMLNQMSFVEQTLRTNPAGAARFLVANTLLFGTDAVAPGADLAATRAIYGKPFKTFASTGFAGYVGAALAEQVSVYGLDPDEMKRVLTYLPGPAVEHVQNIASAISGINMGTGLDIEKFGLPLTPDERARAILRSLPGGSAANRLRQAAKLLASGQEDRAAMIWQEAYGLSAATGPLHMELNNAEHVLAAIGGKSPRMVNQSQMVSEMKRVQDEYKVVSARAADLQISGHQGAAEDMIRNFRSKYPEFVTPMPSPQSLQEAIQRRVMTTAQRTITGAPKGLRGAYTEPLSQGRPE